MLIEALNRIVKTINRALVERGVERAAESFSLHDHDPETPVVGRLIGKGLGTRLYYASLAGFDTHSGQAVMHADLLSGASLALPAADAADGNELPPIVAKK